MPHFAWFDRLQVTGVNRANPNDSPGPFDETGTTDEITGQNATVIVHPNYIPDTEDLTNLEEAPHVWSPTPSCSFTAGPSGTSYLTGYTEVEWTYFADNIGGTAGPGASTYLTSYSEAVGLDSSSTFDVLNNLAGSGSPGGDAI